MFQIVQAVLYSDIHDTHCLFARAWVRARYVWSGVVKKGHA